MPSPFPGMDPYLEDPGAWGDFHARFINYISECLGDHLPDNYHAAIAELIRAVELSTSEYRDFYPDVGVRQTHPLPERHSSSSELEYGGAVAVTLPPPKATMRQTRVEVVRHPDQTLIAVIEVLSPTNKTGFGYYEYAAKRAELLRQDVHLIEIDLLLGGKRPELAGEWPTGDYCALVARAGERPKAKVYPWSLRQPLMAIPVPLAEPDGDVSLPLQEAFQLAYDRGRYARVLRYDRPPPVPLSPTDAQWATDVVARGR